MHVGCFATFRARAEAPLQHVCEHFALRTGMHASKPAMHAGALPPLWRRWRPQLLRRRIACQPVQHVWGKAAKARRAAPILMV